MKPGDLVKHKPEWLEEQYTSLAFTAGKAFDYGIVTETCKSSNTGRVFVRVTGTEDILGDMWFVSSELELVNESR